MKALCLERQGFATSSLMPMLREEFGKAGTAPISPHELLPSALRGTDVLVLPGITGESSPYPQIIPPAKAYMLYRKMEDGLTIIAECAALYWCLDEISYRTSDGRRLSKQGLGWIGGRADGPRPGKGLASDEKYRYADTTTVDIEFYDGAYTYHTPICYSNCPGLFLTETEASNPDVRILARFTEEAETPVAAMTKIVGHGMLVGLGVLPHIKTRELGGRRSDPAQERHRLEVFNKIASHEPSIEYFQRVLFDSIRLHRNSQSSQRQSHPEAFRA